MTTPMTFGGIRTYGLVRYECLVRGRGDWDGVNQGQQLQGPSPSVDSFKSNLSGPGRLFQSPRVFAKKFKEMGLFVYHIY